MKRFAILALLILCALFARTTVHAGDAPLRVGGDVKAPVVIKHVNPLMSDLAKRSGIGGIVIVEAIVDHTGVVKDARIVKPLPYGLDQSALDAVKQWTFRPGTLNGQAVDVIFNVTINFQPSEPATRTSGSIQSSRETAAARAVWAPGDPPLRVGGDVKAPVVIHRVEPVVTELAKRAGISGIVIMEVVIDHTGGVKDPRILKPLPFGLDQAAIDAVKQWTFRPGTFNGQPVDVIFNLTINFRAPDAEKTQN